MARQSAIDDQHAIPAARADSGYLDRSAQPGQKRPTGAPDLARVLLRAHLLRGDLPTAIASARRLSAALPDRPDAVDMLVEVALDHGRAQTARQVLAVAEASIPAAQAAHIKARIAMAEGDFPTAKAILVMAIERHPDHVALRTLLTEVMVAAGTAAEARAVLAHIGQPPVNPPIPGADRAEDANTKIG
jgi:predicted Zn-dependent protease